MHPFLIRGLLRLAVMFTAIGAVLLVLRWPVAIIGLLVLAALRRPRWRGSGHAHGTAAFATLKTLLRHDMLGGTGLILGKTGYTEQPGRLTAVRYLWGKGFPCELSCRLFLSAFFRSRWGGDSLIRITDYTHLATFAPTGRGKGVSQVVPNLLSYPGSVVCTDIKGELVELTARHRKKRFGHRIVILDPFHITGGASDSLNPLDFIDATATDFLDQCRDLANALIFRKGDEHEPHWNDSAELILTAFIAFICACERNPAERNLMTVRLLLTAKSRYTHALEIMQKADAAGGVVQKLAEVCTWFIEKEGASVMTTLHRQTGWIDSPAIAAVMGHSSFDPRGLKSGKMDVYLCMPPERLASLPAVTRMWLDTLLRILSRDGAGERNKILFMLDEVAHLGHIQSLENAVTLMRGYGIRLWFFFQSLGQVKECFGDRAGKFLDNIDTKLFFGLNATETAEAVSKMMGDATIVTESYNETRSRSGSERLAGNDPGGQWSVGSSRTFSEIGRPLMRPDEILRAPEDFGIVLHRNLRPIQVRLLRYFEDSAFRGGGTGLSPGLGLRAFLAALLLLGVSLCLPLAVLLLPVPEHLPPSMAPPPSPSTPGEDFPLPPVIPSRPAYHTPGGRMPTPQPSPFLPSGQFPRSPVPGGIPFNPRRR